jgi:hypothetical protein
MLTAPTTKNKITPKIVGFLHSFSSHSSFCFIHRKKRF